MLSGSQKELSVEYVSIDSLKTNPCNARTHSKHQTRQIAASIDLVGFSNPVLATRESVIVAGHGRVAAAKLLRMTTVPVIRLEGLSADQIRAYVIADNKVAENAGWDKEILAIEFQHLLSLDSDFDIKVTGFEIPEIDIILEETTGSSDSDDAIVVSDSVSAVTKAGDVWRLGSHTIICSDALQQTSYEAVLGDACADVVFTDPPYNVRVHGHVSGKGKIKHREFPMASGEMSQSNFGDFLDTAMARLKVNSRDGALFYVCMDWRHCDLLHAAGRSAELELLNLCVWVKNNGGMGSLYRSQHELVFVFKHGVSAHCNNVQLGRFKRNRTNVWNYPSPSAFGRSGEEGHLAALHPTVKPVAMVADAILDCSKRGDTVLDPFLGSGTTLLAAERVGRTCRGIELDPLYVDVAIRRWQRLTGERAMRVCDGKAFDDRADQASAEHV